MDHVRRMSNTNNIVVPNDIIFEIFLRVPAKSLLRLRWACKYWFDLITRDHDFIKKNLLHHPTTVTSTHDDDDDDDDDDDRILGNTSFWISNSKTVVYTMNFGDVVNNDHDGGGTSISMDCYNLPFSNLSDNDHLEFCGSCNGLVLFVLHSRPIRNDDTYFLWNPCTREVRELPHEPFNTYPVNNSNEYRVLGLGYDHTIDDYKVMRIIFYNSERLNDDYSICHLNMELGVYTLGSNSWTTKIVTDPLLTAHLNKQIRKPGVLVNGALHWTAERGIGTISSFDITKEELQEIQGPNEEELREMERPIAAEAEFKLILSVLNGCLSMCQKPHYTETYVIWMMKDYGVKDSWTKLFTINMIKVLAAPRRHGMRRYRSEPFEQYYKDGGILMVFNRNERDMIIVACDLKKNIRARFIYSIQDRKYRFVNGTYKESLISLNSGIYLTLAVGSRTPTFQKQDLLEYEVRREEYSEEIYLVRKGTKDEKTYDKDEDFEEDMEIDDDFESVRARRRERRYR